MEKRSKDTSRVLVALLSVWGGVSCDPAGPRHDPAEKTSAPSSPIGALARDSAPPAVELPAGGEPPAPSEPGRASPEQRCITPLVEPPPPAAAPAARCPADPDGPLELPQGAVRFADAPSAPRVVVERALDDAARARGLMYRTRLDADAGMLFSWEDEVPRSFWMRNTCIPLDMLFIASDGTIVGILEQVPTLNTLPRGVPCPARHVLEVNAGWAREHGVVPGQKVEFET